MLGHIRDRPKGGRIYKQLYGANAGTFLDDAGIGVIVENHDLLEFKIGIVQVLQITLDSLFGLVDSQGINISRVFFSNEPVVLKPPIMLYPPIIE